MGGAHHCVQAAESASPFGLSGPQSPTFITSPLTLRRRAALSLAGPADLAITEEERRSCLPRRTFLNQRSGHTRTFSSRRSASFLYNEMLYVNGLYEQSFITGCHLVPMTSPAATGEEELQRTHPVQSRLRL